MSNSLILSFNSAVAKYSRLNKKVRKSISKGEFWRYTRRKCESLLGKIERLKRRIAELQLQLKLAGTGLAAGMLMMSAGEALAQETRIGPFEYNPEKNPFPQPVFQRVNNPALTFWDMDNDGDLDASLPSSEYGYTLVYMNYGSAETPDFQRYHWGPSETYWYSGASMGRVAYADVDDDGDLDAIVGMDHSDDGVPETQDDVLYFFRNTASTPEEPPYFVREFSHPFAGMTIKEESWPAFTDIDKDGDLDFVLSGLYDDTDAGIGKQAWIQVFRNDKEGHAPGVDVSYTQLKGDNNPLYMTFDGVGSTYGFLDIAFADLDGDGDEDFFTSDQHGQIQYKRNDNGVFVDQESAYTFQENGASTGNPLSIDNILVAAFNQTKYLSFGDLDGDGDKDLILGTNAVGTVNSPYIYVENQGNGVMVADRRSNNPLTGFAMGDNAEVIFHDTDEDGDNDLLMTGIFAQATGDGDEEKRVLDHLFFTNNDGTFDLETENDPFDGLQPFDIDDDDHDYRLRMVDIDGDSDLDAIYIHQEYDTEFAVDRMYLDYARNDDGVFTPFPEDSSPLKPITDLHYNDLNLDVADLNGDHLPDIVLIGNSNTPTFFRNTGTVDNPIFTEENGWKEGLTMEVNNLSPKFVDLDNDGDNDLVLGKYYYIWYYENIGSSETPEWREFEETYESDGTVYNEENPFGNVFNTEGGNVIPEVSDVDGDGDKDLLFASDGAGVFTYFENTNPAPTVVPGSTLELTFTIGQPVPLAENLTITDSDADRIVRIDIQIEPYNPGLEELRIIGPHEGLTWTWDNVTGLLTITGSGAYVDWQQAVRDVEYIYTDGDDSDRTSGRTKAANGRVVTKTITATILDADLTVAASNTIEFHVTGENGIPNVAPTITGTATAFYISGELVINNNIVLADTDTVFTGATVVFTAGHDASEDELLFTDQNDIVGSYNSTAGLLTLTGTSSIGNYQAALRSVRYRNSSQAPSVQDRALNFSIDDSEAQATLTGTVITINKPPVVEQLVKRAAAGGNIAMTFAQLLSDPDDNLDYTTLEVFSEEGEVTIGTNIVTIDYSDNKTFLGNDVLTITICDTGGRCNTSQLQVEIRAEVFVYTGMSPNGDGINDYFAIDFLPGETKVAIYNRWGDAVYEESNYNMDDPARRFEGKNKNGTDLIAGTYYYKIQYPAPDSRVKTGYILLNR